MARAFTPLFVQNVKPGDRRREIPDPGCRGLHLIVQSTGVKSWAVRYRVGGKAVKLTIGPVAIPLTEARQMAADALAKVARGIDPQTEKKAAVRATLAEQDAARNTFKAVAEMHLKLEGDKQKSGEEKRAILERLVYPTLGDRPIESIKRSDVVALLDQVSAGEFARNGKPSPVMSNRARAAMGAVFNWFANRADDFRSPIVGMKVLNKETPRDRVLTDDEVRAIWSTCEANPSVFNRLCQFLLVTGARRTEGSALMWDEINSAWTLPPERNKTGVELVRPLNKHARRILDSMPRIVDCPYVFPATANTPLVSYSYHKRALDQACGVTGWTLHDLRRTARTMMSRAGVNADVAERMLGHTIEDVRKVYDRHNFLIEMTRGFDSIATLLDQILDPQPNVVALRG